MEAEVTFLTRRGNAVMRKTNRVSADRVRFGRGTFNEVPLLDLRVEMAAAVLSQRGGHLSIEQLGTTPVRLNGHPVSMTSVARGDDARIGPYRVELVEPPEGCDVAITVELLRPLGDAFARLVTNSRLNLQATDLNKRVTSWTAFGVLVLLCLVLPAAVFWGGLITPRRKAAERKWFDTGAVVAISSTIGEMANSHRFFAANCTTCHESAFIAVRDQACIACHQNMGAHIPKAANIGTLRRRADAMRCTHCHLEHRGRDGLVIKSADLCVECHVALAEAAPKDDVRDVGGFPKGHPQFRATVVGNPTAARLERVELDGNHFTADRPGLKFSHAAHLVTGGFPALGYKQMACADCHKPEQGGRGFLPITYKAQCAACHEHELVFAKLDLPWAKAAVPHGDDAGVVAAVWNYYAGQAVEQGAPATSARVEVAAKAEAALRGIVLDDKRGCAYCHYGTGPRGAFDLAAVIPSSLQTQPTASAHFIAPVRLRSRFLPRAVFDHSSHLAMQCVDCHQRRGAESRRSLTTLGAAELAATVPEALDIPGIENCIACHGRERATLRTGSTCVSCHVFHRKGIGKMPDRTAASK